MSKSLFFAATVLAASPVIAAPQDSNSVEQEIQALKERLAQLEKRLEEKEEREKEEVVVVKEREVEKGSETASKESSSNRRVVYDSGVHARLDELEKKTEENENWPIKIHGAVRFQYEYNNYDSERVFNILCQPIFHKSM